MNHGIASVEWFTIILVLEEIIYFLILENYQRPWGLFYYFRWVFDHQDTIVDKIEMSIKSDAFLNDINNGKISWLWPQKCKHHKKVIVQDKVWKIFILKFGTFENEEMKVMILP